MSNKEIQFTELFVLDSETGHAVENVEVSVFETIYSSAMRRNELKKLAGFTTDEKGLAVVNAGETKSHGMLLFTFRKGNDFLVSDGNDYLTKAKTNTKLKTKTYFFTDRAIYRPGQTVYFKGIVVDRNSKEVHIKPGFQSQVNLYDVNRKVIGILDLTKGIVSSLSQFRYFWSWHIQRA